MLIFVYFILCDFCVESILIYEDLINNMHMKVFRIFRVSKYLLMFAIYFEIHLKIKYVNG